MSRESPKIQPKTQRATAAAAALYKHTHSAQGNGERLFSRLRTQGSLQSRDLEPNARLARPISLALPTPVHAMTDKQTVIMTICMERAITCHNAPLVMGTLAESTLGVSGEEIKHSPVHRAARARLHSRPVLSGTTGPKGLGRLAPLRGAPLTSGWFRSPGRFSANADWAGTSVLPPRAPRRSNLRV